jgi:hypothetical protein
MFPLFTTDVYVRGVFGYMKSEKSGLPDSVRRVFLTIYIFQIKIGCNNKVAWTDFSCLNPSTKSVFYSVFNGVFKISPYHIDT